MTTAYALDAVLVETGVRRGAAAHRRRDRDAVPVAALVLGAVLVVGGHRGLRGLRAVAQLAVRARAAGHGALGALRSAGLRVLVVVTLPIGFCFGAMEVTLPAFAEDVANRAWAGALIAIWSAGSALGGLWYGARAWRSGIAERYVRLAWLLPLGYLPLAAAPSLAAMVPLCVLAGVVIAPLLTAGNQLVGEVAPAGALTEAFTWPITALVTGLAAGNAAAGAVVEAADWRAAFLVAAGGAALGAAVALAGRRALVGG